MHMPVRAAAANATAAAIATAIVVAAGGGCVVIMRGRAMIMMRLSRRGASVHGRVMTMRVVMTMMAIIITAVVCATSASIGPATRLCMTMRAHMRAGVATATTTATVPGAAGRG